MKQFPSSFEVLAERRGVDDYYNYENVSKLLDTLTHKIDSLEKQNYRTSRLKKLNLGPHASFSEIRERLEEIYKAHVRFVERLPAMRREAIETLHTFYRERNIIPAQDISAVQVVATNGLLGSQESMFDPRNNVVYFASNHSRDARWLLLHEYAHAASYAGSIKKDGTYEAGFRKIRIQRNEDGSERIFAQGNQWLDEGITTVIEGAAYSARTSRKKHDPYIEAYVWLTYQLLEQLGIDELHIMRAHVGQESYRENLEQMIHEKWGGTIDDLDILMWGFNDSCKNEISETLRGNPVTIEMSDSMWTYSKKRWEKLLAMFPNLTITQKNR